MTSTDASSSITAFFDNNLGDDGTLYYYVYVISVTDKDGNADSTSDATKSGTPDVFTAGTTYVVTLTLADGYTWADGTDGVKRYTFMVLDSATEPELGSDWNATTDKDAYDCYFTDVDTAKDSKSTLFEMAESCTVCGAINIDDMSNWEWVSGGAHEWMWSDETYYTVERRTDENGATVVLFVPEDGTYEIAGYCSVCGTRVSVSFTLEDAEKYTDGDSAWAKANADLASFFGTYGFAFAFTYPEADGEWDCTAGTKLSFTLTISGDTDEYTFDYWYGEDGTHVTVELDEFLGEEKVTFTEESLLGLELYYVTGTVTPDGSGSPATTEVVYVYLMDPVYGTVYVYQYTDDTITSAGGTIPTYDNTFENVTYDFEMALGIYFYQSTDYIGDDWSVLQSGDTGYPAATDDENLFSNILTKTDCTSGPVAIGYFACATCGTYVPVYASMAHTFGDDGLDMTAPPTDSGKATYSWTDATPRSPRSAAPGMRILRTSTATTSRTRPRPLPEPPLSR